jgi:hypothetical protein
MVDDWIRETKIEETEELLIDEVIDRVDDEWELCCRLAKSRDEPEPDFNEFLDRLEAELTRKDERYSKKQKIDPEIAEKIIERVYEKNREFLK